MSSSSWLYNILFHLLWLESQTLHSCAFVSRLPVPLSFPREYLPLPLSTSLPLPLPLPLSMPTGSSADDSNYFFASKVTPTVENSNQAKTTLAVASSPLTVSSNIRAQSRVLGSQELLMLPRQYGPGNASFPSMNHVSTFVLSASPDQRALQTAIANVMKAHPLLTARVEGDGEPSRRIDWMQMVREGEPSPLTFVSNQQTAAWTANDVLTVVQTNDIHKSWRDSFARDLDDGSWCNVAHGPLWKVELHQKKATLTLTSSNDECALLLSFNHAISDQSSANRIADAILQSLAELDDSKEVTPLVIQSMPLSLEESVLGIDQSWSNVQTAGVTTRTLQYVAGKAAEGLKNPVMLPDATTKASATANSWTAALTIISGRTAGGNDGESTARKSTLEFRSLSKAATSKLVAACRTQGVSVSNALTAAATLTATDCVVATTSATQRSFQLRNYKVLQSLDMRRFGAKLDRGETVACMAGSHDLMHGPLKDLSGQALRVNPSAQRMAQFWSLASDGKKQTEDFISGGGAEEAVRVFDFAMTVADLNNLVHLTGQSKDTKGRAYSVGVTNVGVYEKQLGFQRQGETDRNLLQIQHGRFRIKEVFFATPHVTSGCLFQVSCMTLDGQLKFTFNPVEPIVTAETNIKFADGFVEMLEKLGDEPVAHIADDDVFESVLAKLPFVASALGSIAVAMHAGAWASFFSSVMEMKANVVEPADFWAAINFWIFFAVGHPVLQPILWISDVLHGSPGPMIAGLIPATFIAGNLIAIAVVTVSKEIRNAVNIAVLAAFLSYVGAGLEGTAGLGDFNLALDDNYQGRVVKGCPSYEDVRQPSMDDFKLEKYQGLWYEQKFHDWTQFKEVYDTTLAIRLTEGGLGWTDDFAVKGPAPDSAKLSWDKSPVANGAHYFLFGRVDPSDPKGILRESGFGVEFPNYIVDVKKDPVTGEYTEAIQFQCLERGGVRVFEGINFMSRNPTMSDVEMMDMHARAKAAGMNPYGASPEQMHTVARRPVDAPEIDNNWQALWRIIGVDRLLELLTEAIEDGGR